MDFFALVPNLRGAQTAWEVGIRKISYVVSLSESHNRANINRTHEESYEELRKINICFQILKAIPWANLININLFIHKYLSLHTIILCKRKETGYTSIIA